MKTSDELKTSKEDRKDTFSGFPFTAPPENMELLFESAWDMLEKMYPERTLLASDMFSIDVYNEEEGSIETRFILGENTFFPCLHNCSNGEDIRITPNSRRWSY